MHDYLALVFGVGCAAIGGELFVRGAVGLARWLRITPGVIGATVVAFTTSSPELAVSVSASLAGNPQIALGDALGSNVVNVALVLGTALVVAGIHCPRRWIRRDFPVAFLAPLITGVFILDGQLSRIDGLLLMAMFCTWLVATVKEARIQRSQAEEIVGEHRKGLAILACLTGLACLVGAGGLIVLGATSLARALGIDAFMVGAIIVAIGTSTPELATAIVAALRGHSEISLGTILGSNIFNGLWIVAIATIIHPIDISWQEVTATLGFGIVTLVLAFPARNDYIERRRGSVLLMVYVAYLATLIQLQGT